MLEPKNQDKPLILRLCLHPNLSDCHPVKKIKIDAFVQQLSVCVCG